MLKNPAPSYIKVLVRLFVVWPTRAALAIDRGYRKIASSAATLRDNMAKAIAKLHGRPTFINGSVVVPSKESTASFAASILGEYSMMVLDVGARWGAHGAWWRVSPLARFAGFDPDPAECERLNAKLPDTTRERYIPLALGNANGVANLYEAAQPACSSLYPPSENVVERYPACHEIRHVKTHSVALRRLEDWWRDEGKPRVAFLKIDTQGSELDIMKGAGDLLGDVMGCEIEVEFSPMYTGQPLFHEVDGFLREMGFVLWKLEGLTHYNERPMSGRSAEEEVYYGMNYLSASQTRSQGRLFWGNAIYFRDHAEIAPSEKNWKDFLVLASLLDSAGDTDAARSCLRRLVAKGESFLTPDNRAAIETHANNLF